MRKSCKRKIYVMVLLLLTIFIGIGYSYLQTDLEMIGNVNVKKYVPPIRYLYDEIINQNKENGNMVLDNQSSTYVTSSTGINFGVAPSDTNGKGVYVRNGTESDTYPIYYYRGAVTNNNVMFAGFCWKMVRTTETGGIKLIYNGELNEQFETTPIESSGYINVTNDATYPYTYDNTTNNWTSTNKTNSKTGTITFSVATPGVYAINYEVSSESGHDKAHFYLDDVELGVYSGTVSGSISLGEITSANVIKVEYTKDSNSASGSDTVSFNVGLKTGEVKKCNNTGTASQIGTSKFNSSRDYNAYVGYMYGTPNSSSYEEEHANVNSSTIKTYIDAWYSANMTNYTSKLEDTIWCNDRSFASSNTGTGTGNSTTYYGANGRNANSTPTPSLECINQNDRFTVNEITDGRIDGNGALTYPVALLTADELTLAGQGSKGYSKTSYLHTGQAWWSLSPSGFDSGGAIEFYVGSGGFLNYNFVGNAFGARPSVSLRLGTAIESGGDGSVYNPFIVK